jgi:hypothetical protein
VSPIANGSWATDGVTASIALNTTSKTSEVCKEVARQAGANGQFSCTGAATGPQVFSFKL